MANNKNNPYKKSNDPYGPVRKQDPYVSGTGRGYVNGGEGGGKSGGGSDENNDNCMVAAAPIGIGIATMIYVVRSLLRARKG